MKEIKHFAVHNGRVFGMTENGETFATTIVGNTGWVKIAGRITGSEPTDSEAYLKSQGVSVDTPPNLKAALEDAGEAVARTVRDDATANVGGAS